MSSRKFIKKPEPIWCAVATDGAVYTTNSQTDGWKNNILDKKPVFFKNVKTIQNGHVPKMKAYNHIAAGDGILVVLGGNEAQMYDGEKWTQILEPPE